jgi:ubiquinone/menaquinone biosynthesis C-methylase UbiE
VGPVVDIGWVRSVKSVNQLPAKNSEWKCRLRCPFCGGNLAAPESALVADEPQYNVLTCSCGHYPVVAGIPILKKGAIGTAGQTADEVIILIKGGQHLEALFSLISPTALAPAWMRSLPSVLGIRRLKRLAHERALYRGQEKATGLLTKQGGHGSTCEVLDLYYYNKRSNYDYFAYRFGQPRHLVALSFISIILRPNKPILDLACGCGHITRSLVQRAQGQLVIGVDNSFFELYIAKHRVAPEAEYVCCAADTALPFSDGAFAVAFCSDAFHYFVNKTTCLRELERITCNDGLIMLVWMHNANVKPPQGVLRSLPPEAYEALAANLPRCLVSDRITLRRYLQRQGLALARSADTGYLTNAPRLSLVATRRLEVFRDYGPFEDWPHAWGHLGLNPLFVAQGRDEHENVHLRRRFPSAHYEEEHVESKEYLPETVEVPGDVLADLEGGKRTPGIEKLIEQCVVLGIPDLYREL